MGSIPPAEKAHQLANYNEYSAGGQAAFIIAGAVIITVAVALRLWGRRLDHIPWKADDYTLIVAHILTVATMSCSLNNIYNGGAGRHTLTVPKPVSTLNGKTSYAFAVFYTTAYPTARISLCLLYRRVFIQTWFRTICWFLISCYAGYAISTVFVDLFGKLPVQANWDRSITPTHMIDSRKLYLANSGFNIATDAVLLVLPLAVIWTLNMNRGHKLGLSGVFCLGVLTLIASIMRLVIFLGYNKYDPVFSLARVNWWTATELYLGILCPCLVTFKPLLRTGYLVFSSHLSPAARDRIERATGTNTHSPDRRGDLENSKPGFDFDQGSSTTQVNGSGTPKSAPSKHEDYAMDDLPRDKYTESKSAMDAMKRDHDGMAMNQDVALSNLDPRSQAQEVGGRVEQMGTSTQAMVDEERRDRAPDNGIGVSRDWKVGQE